MQVNEAHAYFLPALSLISLDNSLLKCCGLKKFLYDTDLYHIFITDKIIHEKTQFFISFSKILYYFLEYETDCRI